MKKILFTFCLSLCFIAGALAQTDLNPVMTAVPSLTIAPDARAGGMGDVGAATSPDVNSQYWNPAKYAFMESQAGVSLSYTPWLRKLVNDIDLGYLAGYYKLNDISALSGSLRYFSLGDIKLFDENAIEQTTAHPYEMSVDAAYSRLLSDKFSASITMRFIYSDLGNGIPSSGNEMHAGWTAAADVAAYYRTKVAMQGTDGTLGIGLNISNIGGKISYDETSKYFIPTNMRLGASYEYPFDQYNKISFSADANKYLVPTKNSMTDDQYYNISPISGIFKSFSDAPGGFKEEMQEIMWSFGAEYAYNNQFFVRGGYYHESANKGNRKYFTAGAGFKLNIFQLDAGYVISTAQSNPLDQTLRLSLSFDMMGLKNLVK